MNKLLAAFVVAIIATLSYGMPAPGWVSAVGDMTRRGFAATKAGVKVAAKSPLTYAALAGGAVAAVPLSAGLGTALRDSRRQRDSYRATADKKQEVINNQQYTIDQQAQDLKEAGATQISQSARGYSNYPVPPAVASSGSSVASASTENYQVPQYHPIN